MRTMVRVAIAILVSVLIASTAHAKRVALVVGINKYDNLPRERQLAKAVNDARAMEAALKAVGFDVIKAEDVGRSTFHHSWQQLLDKVALGDEVAVFYSGHGVEIDGANYLVPRDVPAVATGQTQRLKNESLSFDSLRRDLVSKSPKLSLFILDACRDNPFTDSRGKSIGGTKGLVPVPTVAGSFIMFAADAFESALDRLSDTDRDPNSVYTRKLLPLLKQPGLRLPDMAQRVRREVRQTASAVGHQQNPAYYDQGGDEVCLAGCAPQTSEAERTWPWIKDSTNQSVLENFIKEFGDTRFAEEAKTRLAELKKQQVAIAAPSKSPAPVPTKPGQPAEAVPPISHWGRCDGGIEEWFAGSQPIKRCLKPKDSFRDCPECPEMMVVPAGEFMMGSNDGHPDEKPVHKVTIMKPFAVGKFEVTFAEWDACVAAGGCNHKPGDEGFGRGNRPVINVSWDDVTKEYLRWLSKRTGKRYRLLTEAEWEYAARAGSHKRYFWGDEIGEANANCGECASDKASPQPMSVGSYPSNSFGLHDMHGNVFEWVQDCRQESYVGAPTDGSPWITGDCSRRVRRGGSWGSKPQFLRSAFRSKFPPNGRDDSNGFRVARTFD
jgi:formylglycine-generating enzyme required for sulfatase activity